jgi:hypothetical protein
MAVSKTLRYQVLRRDNFTCRYCGRGAPEVKLTVDHVVAGALGGRDEPSNLVAACADCNNGKSATPADAAMVADVEADAIRWARAVSVAASHMLDDLRAREADQETFKSRWCEWESSRGATPDLPSDWPATVDRFMAAGLPLPVLLECIDRAMASRKVRHDGLFRYMCGIAWARVSEIHEAARHADRPAAVTATPEGRLADLLVANYDADGFADLQVKAVAALAEAGFEEPSEFTVLLQCVEELIVERWSAVERVHLLAAEARRAVPANKVDALVETTIAELRHYMGEDYTEFDLEFNVARNALIGLGVLAKRAGGAA